VALGLGERPSLPVGVIPLKTDSAEVTQGATPGRGLLYSFLLHEVAIFAILLVPMRYRQERKFYEVERWLRADTKLTYMLPKIGGVRAGNPAVARLRKAEVPNRPRRAKAAWFIPARRRSFRIRPIRPIAFRPSFSPTCPGRRS
jgi:hypothetical protein